MATRRTRLTAAFALSLLLAFVTLASTARVRAAAPERLNDAEFWKISAETSEPDGEFRSENLLSNELGMQWVIPRLLQISKTGRAYLGVGPEQNFTYIAALKPSIVFIIDIRRGNLDLQLMYKALFELSADRADFYSRLFSKPRPAGLTASSRALDIVTAFENVRTSEDLYKQNQKDVEDLLEKTHGFPLSAKRAEATQTDWEDLKWVYDQFYWFGPSMDYNSPGGGFGGGTSPTYADLAAATDDKGIERNFLSSEERYQVLKNLEERNLIVPVVGNFGGPKAIRAVGDYLKSRNETVSAFYLSNVEQYLSQDGLSTNFCRSVATLPLDGASTFIRTQRGAPGPGAGLNPVLGGMAKEVETCR
ncbi:MAG TPA: hypothetical protein VHZ73_05400 [Vicinamibacterales bacterium]|jgi:hypothetical protein|nr:hypothetical protein [Vicinamibacterales bacterium]